MMQLKRYYSVALVGLLVLLIDSCTTLVEALAFTSQSRSARTRNHCFLSMRMTSNHTPSTNTLKRSSLLFPVSGSSKASASSTMILLATDSAATHSDDDVGSNESETDRSVSNEKEKKKTLAQSIKSYFSPPDDGLTFRQRLTKMGMAAVLSYGWVSNMSYSVTVSLAWYIFSKRVRSVTSVIFFVLIIVPECLQYVKLSTWLCFISPFSCRRLVSVPWLLDSGKDSWLFTLGSIYSITSCARFE